MQLVYFCTELWWWWALYGRVEIDDEATSMILSASWASSSRLVVLEVEARITRTLLDSRCVKSSRRKVLSVVLVRSPRNCWIL